MLRQKGLDRKIVLAELKKIRDKDPRYQDGKILCSMCTKPHLIAKKAYELFYESNLGDNGLFCSTTELEQETITQLGELLNCDTARGFIVSGGTEANLLALLAARNKTQTQHPEVILPQSAHFSFKKACMLLSFKPVYVPLDNSFRVNIQEVEKCINKNTIALVGSAGTAELGVIDPIEKLSEIATNHNIHLHVDAAFGGLVIPFLNETSCSFDFQLDGVKSMTVDPHKMGMTAVPAGGILFRDTEMLDYLKIETPYLSSRFQYTFTGTRTGASVASTWAVFQTLGKQGFRKIIKECMKNTKYLTDEIQRTGFSLVCKPTLNIIAFRAKNTKELAKNLWNKGWYVSYIPQYDCIRIVVMPHFKRKHITAFLSTLKKEKL